MKEAIHRYFEEHTDELIADIAKLVAIESDRRAPEENAPYGKGAAAVLDEAEAMIADAGFAAKNHDHYVVTGDMNEGETRLGILAHLDIVPVGPGWTRPPLTLTREGNFLYGRGAADNKGPAVAVLWAMKCLKELGVPLRYNCRLILGSDEECGSSDLDYYFARNPYPTYTVTPDSGYPIINTEKGRLELKADKAFEKEEDLPRVARVTAGVKLNVVPAEAEALLLGMTEEELVPYLAAAKKKTGAEFTALPEGEGVLLRAKGESAHAAWPELGLSGISALLELLLSLPLAPSASETALRQIAALFPFGETDGRSAGIAMSDELSGALSIAVTILTLSETGVHFEADCRAATCASDENVTAVLKEKLAAFGFKTGDLKMIPPHHTPADSPICKTLSKIYEEYTGRPGECIAIGGGTYVHNIEGGVGFGCEFPEDQCGAHGPDEHATLSNLLISGEMYARLIAEICG